MSMKLLCDQMLGSLATWLRILGYDTAYVKEGDDGEIVARARGEGRVLLTRDKELAASYEPSLLLESTHVREQLESVLRELHLSVDWDRVLSRCTVCNRPVEAVDRESVRDEVPPRAYQEHERFWRCPSCGRVYWTGTHWDNMRRFIASLRAG